MNRSSFAMLTSIIALVAMVLMLREPKPSAQSGDPITVFSAASNRAVLEAIRADYEKEFARSVHKKHTRCQERMALSEYCKRAT